MPYRLDRHSGTVKSVGTPSRSRRSKSHGALDWANAVVDAIGLRCRDLPLSPDRVFQALAEGAAEASADRSRGSGLGQRGGRCDRVALSASRLPILVRASLNGHRLHVQPAISTWPPAPVEGRGLSQDCTIWEQNRGICRITQILGCPLIADPASGVARQFVPDYPIRHGD